MVRLVPIRSDNGYFGVSKEIVPGSPVAPSIFPRWMDGSSIQIDLSAENVMEGDGSRRLSLIVKNKQVVKIKLTFIPRANELGYFEAAAMGASSDSYTAPAFFTTISAQANAGATSVTVSSTTGLGASGTVPLVIGAGSSSEEIVVFNLPASGNVLTVASAYNNGTGTLKFQHNSGSVIAAAASHVLTDQTDGNYYTIEVGLGSLFGSNGTTIRVASCKCDTLKRSASAGGILTYEMDWVGIACSVQSSPATVTLENHLPFLYTQGNGTWNIDGSLTSNDALAIEMFSIEQKNNIDADIQTEQLTLAATSFGMLDMALGFDLVYTNPTKIYQTYFGGPTGTSDAQTLGTGSFGVTFTQPDTLQSVSYQMNTVAYTKADPPTPKKDGKHYKLSVSGTSTAATYTGAPNNTFVLQTTVTNTNYGSY